MKTSFVLATGERASAINIISMIDKDSFRWQSTNREVAGELLPSIPEVTVIRVTGKDVAGEDSVAEQNEQGASK